MPRRSKYGGRDTIVERAINKVGGRPQEFARRLSEYAGVEIPRQRVHGWRMRGTFPRDVLVWVENLTGIPMIDLVTAQPVDRDQGNVVNRAIRLMGEGATPSMLAAALSKSSGRTITRQMVNGWQVTQQFPVIAVPYVHMLTKIPVKDLVATSKPAARPKKPAARPKKKKL